MRNKRRSVSLAEYTSPGVRVWSSRERGRLVGEDIDRRFRGPVDVEVPEDAILVSHDFTRALVLASSKAVMPWHLAVAAFPARKTRSAFCRPD